MIKQNTVFILGAGSATPYKFPIGEKLKQNICLTFINDYVGLPYPQAMADQGGRIRGLREEEAKEFTSNLKRATGLSIDQFLQINKSHLMEGKIAILLNIMKAERDSIFRTGKEDWYSYIFGRMMTKCIRDENPDIFAENNVKFITFNYDRSLEYFLADSFNHNFSDLRNEVKLLDIVDKIKIHHVYGSLGKLPWQKNPADEDSLAYGKFDLNYLLKDSTQKHIKLINERNETDRKIIQETISNAERIFFLGFSYQQENLEVLGFPNCLSPNHKTHIYGTTLGLHPKRKEEVIHFLSSISNGPFIYFKDVNSYKLLYEYLWE